MNFYCGFYSELKELKKQDSDSNFGFLENLRVTSESSAHNFLHGCCDEFAAMLSEIYGYEIECVRNADDRLIHAYCISYIGDEKAYIDIRGITTDPKSFFSEFENELTYYPPDDSILVLDEDGCEVEAAREIWANKDELFDGEYEKWDDPEIKEFIKDYGDYYNTDKYLSLYKCKACGVEFEANDSEDHEWFAYCGEEELWGHLQSFHPAIFEECRDWETPFMLEEYFDHVIKRRSNVMEHNINKGCIDSENKHRDLDAIINDAKNTLLSRKGPDDGGPGGAGAPAREMEPKRDLPDAISR